MEQILKGTVISGGITIGQIHFYNKNHTDIKIRKVADIPAEIARYEAANAQAVQQLEQLYEKAVADVGEDEALIFAIHQMLLGDQDYNNSIKQIIEFQGLNAEYAVYVTYEKYAFMFNAMDNEYMKARSMDIKDISQRILNILMENMPSHQMDVPSILMADELTPSETVQMDKSMLLGFITKNDTVNSHTAILSRTMNVPAVSGIEINASYDGKMAIIDGIDGCVIIEPDEETKATYEKKMAREAKRQEKLKAYIGRETINTLGKKVNLFANIGSMDDMQAVLDLDAEGIGLLRTEFLYMEEHEFPSDELQFDVYRRIALMMGDKKVIIRTLDIGADKQADYFGLAAEMNPALGVRGIRYCILNPDVLKTQLRAIYRASVYGNISIMLPMISSVWEVHFVKQLIVQVKEELDREGIAYKDVELGIMIETPAAVMLGDALAKEVDFFSIGTNDLVQYTLAVDRQNPNLERFYDDQHIGVMRMIKMTVDYAHAAGIWCGICGELASDPSLTDYFMKIGVDELSVAPAQVLSMRQRIVEGDYEKSTFSYGSHHQDMIE